MREYNTFSSVTLLCVVVFAAMAVFPLVRGAGMCGCEYRYDLLMDFYNSTDGPNWVSYGWNTTSSCTYDWVGVTCGTCATCATGFDITNVNLESNFVEGTLPASWGNMTSLQGLYLNSNSLTGTLPSSWGNLSSLTTLDLSYNSLSGTLPASWGNMSSLRELQLHYNSLSGALSASWGSIANIMYLGLNNNSLSGTIPDSWLTSPITPKRSWHLSGNRLNGGLPEYSSVTGLGAYFDVLDLSYNSLSGSLPASWGNITSMTILYLNNNSLSGTFPASWLSSPVTTQRSWYLSGNRLSGLPEYSATGLGAYFDVLDLSYNSLSGSLPASWGNISSITTLYLNNNILSGTLPVSWLTLPTTSQRSWYLSGNQLSGLPEYPNTGGISAYFTVLDLSYNSLSGTLPASWGSISNIETLRLNNNSLSGTLPASWLSSPVTTERSWYLSGNRLNGELPEYHNTTGFSAYFSVLDLSYNSLSGSLPASWGNISFITTLYLNNNILSGTFPASWLTILSCNYYSYCYYYNTRSWYLSGNRLNGALPEYSGVSSVRPSYSVLDLSYNSLSGTLPPSWGSISNILTLYINHNSLSGTLPASWLTLPTTSQRSWYLSGNRLSGELPEYTSAAAESFSVLDLSFNSFSGTLPVSWGNFSISALNLTKNRLSGTLPTSWLNRFYFPSNEPPSLYLSDNSLSGTLPEVDFWNSFPLFPTHRVSTLDLSNNHFYGTLPESWGNLTSEGFGLGFRIQSLSLSTNNFSGTVPATWGNLYLVGMDLSNNNLSGTLLPSWFNRNDRYYFFYSGLSVLKLRKNHFSGVLPEYRRQDDYPFDDFSFIDLSYNSIAGSLPSSWGTMSNLYHLDLSHNELSGSIPPQWSAMGYSQARVELNFSFNNLLFGNISVPLSSATQQWCIDVFNTHINSSFESENGWNCFAPPTNAPIRAPIHSSTIVPIESPLPPAVTVKSVAQVSSGVGAALAVVAAAPSSGFAVDRLTTLSGFGDCSDAVRSTVQNVMNNGVPTFLDAPLQLSFGDEFGASQRGTVLGNLLVFIIASIVSLAAVVVHRCTSGTRRHAVSSLNKPLLLQSAAALRLPGATIVIVVLLLDSLVASSVLLVGYGTNASDIALGAFGLLVVAVLLIVTLYVLDPRPLAFQAIPVALEHVTVSDELISTHGLRTRIAVWWDRIKTPSNKWEARKVRNLFVEHFGYLFEGCRGGRHWWILVEASTTIIVSTLSSVVPETEAACVTRAWIALGLMSIILVACVAVWPMNTHIETGTAILLLCAQVIVVVCAIGGVGNVADIIGLSVSISSAAVALLPIAWWMISFLQTCWNWNKKKAPRDLLLEMRSWSLVPSERSSSSKMLRRSTSIPSATSFRGNSEVVTTPDSLRVMIEMICDTHQSSSQTKRDSNMKNAVIL